MPRVHVRITCHIEIDLPESRGDKRVSLSMTMLDLNDRGCMLRGEIDRDLFKLLRQKTLSVEVDFGDALGDALSVPAKTVWAEPGRANERVSELGLFFDGLPDDARDRINSYLTKCWIRQKIRAS